VKTPKNELPLWCDNSKAFSLPTAVILMCGVLTQSRGVGHGYRSLMTPERVLSEYNKDLNF